MCEEMVVIGRLGRERVTPAIAASRPSAAMCSTASAAIATARPRDSRTASGGRRRTCDAPCAALGGLPTPMRTRRKSASADATGPIAARCGRPGRRQP